MRRLDTIRARTSVLAASALLALVATTAPAQMPDHLACYKVTDALNLTGSVDLAAPQLGLDQSCRVSTAKLFCVPATTANPAATDKRTGQPITPLPIPGPDPGARICYKVKCPKADVPDRLVTDPFGTRVVRKFRGELLCAPAVTGGPPTTTTSTSTTTTTTLRFVDNGDGTVTDNRTGLQWEQKTADGSVHDWGNLYAWSTTRGEEAPNGTAFTEFLGKLNRCVSEDGHTVIEGFAGHCDWRLPTIAELQTILLARFPCDMNPCIDPVFGPTSLDYHLTSTSYRWNVSQAWIVEFHHGDIWAPQKGWLGAVRAVRGPQR
jgi:hypothetical protein